MPGVKYLLPMLHGDEIGSLVLCVSFLFPFLSVYSEEHHYERGGSEITAQQCKHAINMSMKSLFGEVRIDTIVELY